MKKFKADVGWGVTHVENIGGGVLGVNNNLRCEEGARATQVEHTNNSHQIVEVLKLFVRYYIRVD